MSQATLCRIGTLAVKGGRTFEGGVLAGNYGISQVVKVSTAINDIHSISLECVTI